MNIIMLHGGVETPATPKYYQALQEAAGHGFQVLQYSRSPVAALEAALMVLEKNPLFNAGYGSVLNAAGEVEMDAAICDGKTGSFGAVGAIQNVAHPIAVARKVMEETTHVILAGPGAEQFARAKGYPRADCVTAAMRHSWEQFMQNNLTAPGEAVSLLTGLPLGSLPASDTVGGLICDAGHLVAGSSTGGSFLKLPGRIGDTPILGGGILASDNVAVVCTGIGEAFIETMTASYVQHLLNAGITPQAAAEMAIFRLSQKKALPGGMIVLNQKGDYGAAYNSYSFPVVVMSDGSCSDFQPFCSPLP
jgi:beta-aspartyl-peptidase (threonine type)